MIWKYIKLIWLIKFIFNLLLRVGTYYFIQNGFCVSFVTIKLIIVRINIVFEYSQLLKTITLIKFGSFDLSMDFRQQSAMLLNTTLINIKLPCIVNLTNYCYFEFTRVP